MRKAPMILGIVFLVLAVAVFLFGTGMRVLYSGGFFVLLGIVLLLNAKRSAHNSKS